MHSRGTRQRTKVRRLRQARQLAVCTSVHQPVPVARRQVRTGDYSEEMRARLGKAVEEARIAAGYLTRPEFAEKAGVGLRSLVYLEQADRSVGQKVLFPIARALPNWTADTPRHILEGGEPPDFDEPTQELTSEEARELLKARLAAVLAVHPEIHDRLEERRRQMLLERTVQAIPDESVRDLLTEE